MRYKIDPEFRDLLPPLTEDESRRLRRKIEMEGPDRITIVNINGERFLMDGHNTARICGELKVQPPHREIALPSRELVIEWIIDNQLARRNLTDEARAYFIGKEYLQKKGQQGGDRKSEESRCHGDTLIGNTAEAVAEKHDVSPITVKRAAEFAAAVDQIAEEQGPEAKAAILSGEAGTRKEVIAAAKPSGNGHASNGRPARKPKAGQELYSWKDFDKHFGIVARAADQIAAAYEGEKDSQEFRDCHQHLDAFIKTFRAWQKRLQTVKA